MKEKFSRRGLLVGGTLAMLTQQFGIKVLGEENSQVAKDLDHEKFMRRAIEQAKKVPECPFGAVVVSMSTKKVIGEGWVRAKKNPIWHGEMTAINNCPDDESGFKWSDACLYTTGESCPMCQSAIIWTGMPLVVYGSSMPFLQSQKFGEINIRAKTVIEASLKGKCQIIGGVLERECNALFESARKMI
jgi:tRNA(adenine34) deaminase